LRERNTNHSLRKTVSALDFVNHKQLVRPVIRTYMSVEATSKSSNGFLLFLIAAISMIIGAVGFYAFKRHSARKFNNSYFDLLAAEHEV
jgi:hypothetical protein